MQPRVMISEETKNYLALFSLLFNEKMESKETNCTLKVAFLSSLLFLQFASNLKLHIFPLKSTVIQLFQSPSSCREMI